MPLLLFPAGPGRGGAGKPHAKSGMGGTGMGGGGPAAAAYGGGPGGAAQAAYEAAEYARQYQAMMGYMQVSCCFPLRGLLGAPLDSAGAALLGLSP